MPYLFLFVSFFIALSDARTHAKDSVRRVSNLTTFNGPVVRLLSRGANASLKKEAKEKENKNLEGESA